MGGPLAGVRVLELAGIGPAPYAALVLADLGAEVLRVDRPVPYAVPGADLDPTADLTRRNRRSAVLDLTRPEGVGAVLTMCAAADVLLEGFRPGVAERLGVGPGACRGRNPRLVYGRMTGWGQEGPLAGAAGHDLTYLAVTGALHALGRAGGPPAVPLNLLGDLAGGGLWLALGVLAALWERDRSGQGQVVDAAVVDGTAHLTTLFHGLLAAGLWRDERGVNLLDGGAPFYDVYRTADGGWLAVGALEDRFYAELVAGLGLTPEEADRSDPREWPALRARIAAAVARRTRAEWAAVFDGTDACAAPVLSLTEAPDHPQLRARGTFVQVGGVRQPAPAPRFDRTPNPDPVPPPVPGADTRAALAEWGVPDVAGLLAAGVARQA